MGPHLVFLYQKNNKGPTVKLVNFYLNDNNVSPQNASAVIPLVVRCQLSCIMFPLLFFLVLFNVALILFIHVKIG